MTEEKVKRESRYRYWTFLTYPESAPLDWRDIINEEHIEWVESPLHDKDVTADGEIKKAHWHILIMYDSPKTFKQAQEITVKLNATVPQKVASARGLVRYMAHLDDPDKYQYSPSDIVAHGGADITELLKPSASARYAMISEMLDYIEINGITEMIDMLRYARTERFDDWFPLLCDNSAYIVNAAIKSNRHRPREVEKENDDNKEDPKYDNWLEEFRQS